MLEMVYRSAHAQWLIVGASAACLHTCLSMLRSEPVGCCYNAMQPSSAGTCMDMIAFVQNRILGHALKLCHIGLHTAGDSI